jgi:hypothetical protein
MNQPILESGRSDYRNSTLEFLPLYVKAPQVALPKDNRHGVYFPPIKKKTNVYTVTSQFGVVTSRSAPSRSLHRLKDSSVENRTFYLGNGVIAASGRAAMLRRAQMFNGREVNL